ncbi:hypothetical protein FHETE_6842 [Fusarium heterosporum]|uniref:DUF7908 domain-containing protein n=1 Tax=Fusarium heterosporum TaxID=42747 RepID=A0A8H5WJE6_FUSHE|nr:hypothetical protein FHETE_6842 [Fusarium heterosporum]
MIVKALILTALAAGAAAGPCRPGALSSNSDTVTSDSTIVSTPLTSVVTSVQDDSGDSTTTSESPTSVTTTTEAAITSSPSDSGTGTIIFGINPNIRHSKRDTTFFGSDDPSSCTGASPFRLSEGQLLENGIPIFWSEQRYQKLGAQGEPVNDAITTTFSVIDGKLSWVNDEFGEAEFCEDGSGQVYITFGRLPDGCESVSLTAYKEMQCQNGQIVELQPSTSEIIASTVSTDEISNIPTINPTETITAATTTSADACLLGIGGTNGLPPREDRLSDCSALYTVTVSPYTITSTVLKRELAVRIPTGRYTGQPVINTLVRRAEGEETATTIQPTDVPTYATYCDSPSDYYEACSEAGITGFTTTLPTPTTSTSSTITDCPMRKMAKRAGEAVGYKYEENWEAYNMPGYKLF